MCLAAPPGLTATGNDGAVSAVFNLIESQKLEIHKSLFKGADPLLNVRYVVKQLTEYHRLCHEQLEVWPAASRITQRQAVMDFKEQFTELATEDGMEGTTMLICMKAAMLDLAQAKLPASFQKMVDMNEQIVTKAHTKLRVQQQLDAQLARSTGHVDGHQPAAQYSTPPKPKKQKTFNANYKPKFTPGPSGTPPSCLWHGHVPHQTKDCDYEKQVKQGLYPGVKPHT